MRPIQVTLPGTGVTAPIVLDVYIAPTNLSFTMIMQGGGSLATGTVAVEHTNDDIFAPNYNPATGNWTVYAASTSSPTYSFTDTTRILEGIYAFGVRAIRFRATSLTGTPLPSWLFQVTQSGATT